MAIAQMSAAFTISGLVIATVAAALMFYFPPRVVRYTEKGQPEIPLVGKPTAEGQRAGQRQAFLSRLGPGLLVLGFLLQLVGVILQLSGK